MTSNNVTSHSYFRQSIKHDFTELMKKYQELINETDKLSEEYTKINTHHKESKKKLMDKAMEIHELKKTYTEDSLQIINALKHYNELLTEFNTKIHVQLINEASLIQTNLYDIAEIEKTLNELCDEYNQKNPYTDIIPSDQLIPPPKYILKKQ